MATENFNQWSTARQYLGTLPSWPKTKDDQERVAAYQLYQEIYWNVPLALKASQRGSERDPVYIPSARKIIEAKNRYYGRNFDYRIEGGSQSDREALNIAMQTLFRREKFYSKYNSTKRFSLVRGDSLWHIVGDDTKPEGRRISMFELQPDMYFPIYNLDNVEEITGCHIAQLVKDPVSGKALIRRQTYRKTENGTITSELADYEATAWDDRNIDQDPKGADLKLVKAISPPTELPPEITAIPVYHIHNQYQGGFLYGSSDLRGFERIIAAINQSITDEELTLALDGLGVYWSTAPRPKDGWALGPGTVIEGDEGEVFERVSGLANVEPFQGHVGYLDTAAKEASGTPDIAIGRVDVSIAESGIALALQMAPVVSQMQEKEAELLATYDHMMFDLSRMWLPAYEGINAGTGVSVKPYVGDALPVDRAAVIQEVIQLLSTTPPIITTEYARKMLAEKLGYEFPTEMGADILTEVKAATTSMQWDMFTERLNQELAVDAASQNGNSG